MAKILETERLILRHWEISDAEQLFDVCNDPDVMLHIGDGKPFENIERAKKFLDWAASYQKENGFCRWAVVEKSSEKIIGSCGFARLENDEIDLGYLFAKDSWGKGYATEAAGACLKFGFENLKFAKIIAMVDIDHIPSQKVLEKIGFKPNRVEKTETGDDLIFEIKIQEAID